MPEYCAGAIQRYHVAMQSAKLAVHAFSLISLAGLLAACVGEDSIRDRRPGQVMVCHEGKSIVVSNADLFVHQSHGDPLGPCPEDGD